MSDLDRLTCEQTFRKLDDYVDRELSADESRKVEEHLKACTVCASEFAYEASVLREVRAKLARLAAPPDLLDRVRRALEAQATERRSE